MTQPNHRSPMVVDRTDHEEGDYIGDHDVSVEEVALDISNREHAESIALTLFKGFVVEIGHHVDGNEDATGEENDPTE